MSDTTVSLLTPPGTGAIATVELRGPRAREVARTLFKPVGKPLAESDGVDRFWFGTLGNDEVVLAFTAPDVIEIHCHGGRRVVQWLIGLFTAQGCRPATQPHHPKRECVALLPHAVTLRTASILLDQSHGAFATEIRRILSLLSSHPHSAQEPLRRLAELGRTVGRHLVEPWRIVIAGPPNVGKSSLVNALAGYQRVVVSEIAGTTRDTVSVRTALDGWPVELIDTAGLRDAAGLEADGIERARQVLARADLVVWVMDASSREVRFPDAETEAIVNLPRSTGWILVMNKSDCSLGWPPNVPVGAIHLSATTGENLPHLAEWIAFRLVPNPPTPGEAVPFTSQLADLIEAANAALAAGLYREATQHLHEALADNK